MSEAIEYKQLKGVQKAAILLTVLGDDAAAVFFRNLPEDDLQIVLSVRQVLLTIIGTAAEQWRASAGRSSSIACAKRVMRLFEEHKVLIPRQTPRR